MREVVWTLNSLDARPRHGRFRRYRLGSPHFWQHRTDGSSTRRALPSRPPDGQDGRKDPDAGYRTSTSNSRSFATSANAPPSRGASPSSSTAQKLHLCKRCAATKIGVSVSALGAARAATPAAPSAAMGQDVKAPQHLEA